MLFWMENYDDQILWTLGPMSRAPAPPLPRRFASVSWRLSSQHAMDTPFCLQLPSFFSDLQRLHRAWGRQTDLNSLFFLVIAMCSLHSKRDGKEICPGSWCHLEMRPGFSFPRSATAQIAQHSGFRLLNQPAFTHFTQKLFKPEEKWIRENPMFSYHLSIILLDLR